MQDPNLITLFDRIQIQNSRDFDDLIDNLSDVQSDYIVKIAIEKAFNSGIFTLSESELLSKSLRKLNDRSKTQTDESAGN